MIKLDSDYGKGKQYAAIPFIATISSLRDLATVLPHNREEGIKSNQIKLVMLCCIVFMFVFMLEMLMITMTMTMTMVGNNYDEYIL